MKKGYEIYLPIMFFVFILLAILTLSPKAEISTDGVSTDPNTGDITGGTLTSGKGCTYDGTDINCISDFATLTGAQTLTNKTLTTPDITSQTSLPTCNSSNEGKVDYYAPAAAPGFMVACIDNGGIYELIPMTQKTAGYVWRVDDFTVDADKYITSVGVAWGEDVVDTGHVGVSTLRTAGSGTAGAYFSWDGDGSTASSEILSIGNTGYTTEYIFQTDTSTASVRYLIGLSSEKNVSTLSGDYIFFRYDTGNSDTTWQAVNRDGTTGTETVTDTGVTVSASTWYRLIIVRSASDIKFYIGTADADVALEATHTTNLPVTNRMTPYFEVRETSTSSRELNIDYFRFSKLGVDR